MEESSNKKQNNNDNQEKNTYIFDFDELKMYFREPYMVKMRNGKYIEIIQPSIGDILRIGDRIVYSSISPFINNTTSYRVQLWDAGQDWNKISDYTLFTALAPHISHVEFLLKKVDFIENPNYNPEFSEEENKMMGCHKYIKIYKDINFSKLELYGILNEETGGQDVVLYDDEQDIIIDEELYMHIRAYLRKMFNQYPKEEFAKGKLAKQWIINEEKENIKLENEKNNGRHKSVLLPMVSSLLNHPGFKYDLEGMKQLGIFAFMDSVCRLQVYEQSTAFMGGMYSGFMDTSKLGQDELNKRVNWLQDIYEK